MDRSPVFVHPCISWKMQIHPPTLTTPTQVDILNMAAQKVLVSVGPTNVRNVRMRRAHHLSCHEHWNKALLWLLLLVLFTPGPIFFQSVMVIIISPFVWLHFYCRRRRIFLKHIVLYGPGNIYRLENIFPLIECPFFLLSRRFLKFFRSFATYCLNSGSQAYFYSSLW